MSQKRISVQLVNMKYCSAPAVGKCKVKRQYFVSHHTGKSEKVLLVCVNKVVVKTPMLNT